MGVACGVQMAIAGLYAVADPAFGMAGARLRARMDDRSKIRIQRDAKAPLSNDLAQAAGTAELIERDDRAFARFDPEDFRVIATVRHRENAAAIG